MLQIGVNDNGQIYGRTLMEDSVSSRSSLLMCTNCSGRSSAAAKAMTSSAVNRVCRRLLTNTRTGFSGECACGQSQIGCLESNQIVYTVPPLKEWGKMKVNNDFQCCNDQLVTHNLLWKQA